jgi:hypothetical protein
MRRTAGTVVMFVLWFASGAAAQSGTITTEAGSNGEQSAPTKTESASGTGISADMKVDFSNSAQGALLQLVPSIGYSFNSWGVDVGVPLESGNASATAVSATSSRGLGDLFLKLYYTIGSDRVSLTSTVLGTAPTGDSTTGLGAGQPTWNWTNHIDGGLGWITPFVDAGVGNSINSAASAGIRVGGGAGRPVRTVTTPTRPYTTIGRVVQLDTGLDVDVRALSFSLLAYDTIPRGNQTAISRFVVLPKQPNPSSPSSSPSQNKTLRSTKGQRFFELNAVTNGAAALTRDNGFGASVGIKPTRYLDVYANYSHSVQMKLDIVSVTMSTDLASLFRKAPPATTTAAIDQLGLVASAR